MVEGKAPVDRVLAKPRCRAGRRWLAETQCPLRAPSCQVLEALDQDSWGQPGRTWGGESSQWCCHLGKKTQCGQMPTFKEKMGIQVFM